MPTWVWILIVAAVAAAAALGTVAVMQQRHRAQLRDRFGPEYDRAVDEYGGRREAERDLSERMNRREELEIRSLTYEERADYAARWESVQAKFVDRPDDALASADKLIVEVMRRRGYPVDSFDDRAALASADYPEVIDLYRSAYAVKEHAGTASTEELRRGLVHYRALFDAMVADGDVDDVADDGDREVVDDDSDREVPARDREDVDQTTEHGQRK